MDLEQALARIAELEGQVTASSSERDAATGERDTLAGRVSELEVGRADMDARLAETAGAHSTVAADLAAAQQALSAAHTSGLANLRRALLAEQAGRIVPELVGGDDEETLLASVEVAKQAYSRAMDAARASIAQQTVPAGAPAAHAASAAGLSPLEMIETGLRR